MYKCGIFPHIRCQKICLVVSLDSITVSREYQLNLLFTKDVLLSKSVKTSIVLALGCVIAIVSIITCLLFQEC